MIDFKALKGDTTDNIPGIAGVGEKTAAEARSRSTARSTASTSTSTRSSPRSCASSSRETARRRLPLARAGHRPTRDVPVELDLEPARLGDYDRDEVLRLFREYEFRSLVERLPGMTGEEAAGTRATCCARRTERADPGRAGRRPAVGRASAPHDAARGVGMQLSLDLGASRSQAAAPPARRSRQRPTPATAATAVRRASRPTAVGAAEADCC